MVQAPWCAHLGPPAMNESISRRLAEASHQRATREHSKLHPAVALAIGLMATASTTWLTILVMRHLEATMEKGEISPNFVELVMLPLATTTVEGIISVLHAQRQEMDWAMQTTIKCTVGMVLFVMPVTICIGWAMGVESMTLHFDGFQVVTVFLTVIVLIHIFQGPSGRW